MTPWDWYWLLMSILFTVYGLALIFGWEPKHQVGVGLLFISVGHLLIRSLP
jgi:hypothetical protein